MIRFKRFAIPVILAAATVTIGCGHRHLHQPGDVPPGKPAPAPDTKGTDKREPYVVDEMVPPPPEPIPPVPLPEDPPKPAPTPSPMRTY